MGDTSRKSHINRVIYVAVFFVIMSNVLLLSCMSFQKPTVKDSTWKKYLGGKGKNYVEQTLEFPSERVYEKAIQLLVDIYPADVKVVRFKEDPNDSSKIIQEQIYGEGKPLLNIEKFDDNETGGLKSTYKSFMKISHRGSYVFVFPQAKDTTKVVVRTSRSLRRRAYTSEKFLQRLEEELTFYPDE